MTDVTDEEGGHWSYNRTANEFGYTLTEVLTAEGNRTAYGDRNFSTGAYTSTIYDPTGAQTVFSQSVDGLTVNKSLPCGMELESKYDIDSEYGFKYVKEIMQRSPSGLEMVTTKNKTYEDTDFNDVPDLITETVAVNGKTTTLAHNTLLTEKVVTSPEGRTVKSLYDPDTLLSESVSVPGLYDTLYNYDSRGRLTSIGTNTRQTAFAYNSEGFLETVTIADSLVGPSYASIFY